VPARWGRASACQSRCRVRHRRSRGARWRERRRHGDGRSHRRLERTRRCVLRREADSGKRLGATPLGPWRVAHPARPLWPGPEARRQPQRESRRRVTRPDGEQSLRETEQDPQGCAGRHASPPGSQCRQPGQRDRRRLRPKLATGPARSWAQGRIRVGQPGAASQPMSTPAQRRHRCQQRRGCPGSSGPTSEAEIGQDVAAGKRPRRSRRGTWVTQRRSASTRPDPPGPRSPLSCERPTQNDAASACWQGLSYPETEHP